VLMNPALRRRAAEGLAPGQLRLAAEEDRGAPSSRPSTSHRVRSAKARPFAKKALRDAKRGDYKSAKFQLEMALQHEPDSPILLARLADVEQKLAAAKGGA
jgi:Tfp pilus assembly protein PilF